MDEMNFIDTALALAKDKKFVEMRKLFENENPVDIALLLGELPEAQMPVVFRILPKELAADTFAYIDSDEQEVLIKAFSDKELSDVIEELYLDDTVDMIEEMPASVVKRILQNTPMEKRNLINQFLQYPKDSAGSIMTTEYVNLKRDMTVKDAFRKIRSTGVDKETIYTCYVTDENRVLLGLVTVRELLLKESDTVICDIMETNIVFARTHDDQEYVANLLGKYGFLAIPIVDGDNRLVGIVTVDDAIDVIQEEATEDIEKMAAMTPSEKPYMKTSIFSIFKNRIPWLLILMISSTFTGYIITSFESALAASIVLTAFIPMLMDTGGNAGSQASVTVIRGISLGEISFSDLLSVLWKEVRVSALVGVTLAVANFAKLMLIDRVDVLVAVVVCITIGVTVLIAKVIGCILPLISKKLGFDPAVMSSPFITTIVDAISLFVYFTIASSLLGL
ncbi:MAG: magnesium transporter [Oscillospiraceae bacterium]|jgi:magnesium transporter|nr:magnesium transporter [Oscillospiraceae bacterium]